MRIHCDAMIKLHNIGSLTDFQRNAKAHLKRLKKSGRPQVLTVNGQAELVVQDAASYQKLLDELEQAELNDARDQALSGIQDAPDPCLDRKGDEGRPGEMPAGWCFGLHRETCEHRPAPVAAPGLAVSIGPVHAHTNRSQDPHRRRPAA